MNAYETEFREPALKLLEAELSVKMFLHQIQIWSVFFLPYWGRTKKDRWVGYRIRHGWHWYRSYTRRHCRCERWHRKGTGKISHHNFNIFINLIKISFGISFIFIFVGYTLTSNNVQFGVISCKHSFIFDHPIVCETKENNS